MKEGNGEAVSFFHFSLIRAVGCAEDTLVRQKSKNFRFFFVLCSLIRTVGYAEGTLVRQKSKNFRFFFVLCSLIRTFALAIGSPPHQNWMVWRRS